MKYANLFPLCSLDFKVYLVGQGRKKTVHIDTRIRFLTFFDLFLGGSGRVSSTFPSSDVV